jgi:DNA-binding CsgD family transcriptional regulator/tetratricopeptide (TPR) repeat protein
MNVKTSTRHVIVEMRHLGRRGGGRLCSVLFGRDEVIALLAARISEREPTVLVGEAGLGKTAVLRAAARLSARRVFEGGGFATLSWLSYFPITRALGRAVPIGDTAMVAAFVEGVVDGGVLLLDDAHWWDSSSRALLPLLSGRVSVVTAVRRGDSNSLEVLEELRAARFGLVELEPLAEEFAVLVARQARSDLSTYAAQRIARRAGGNPLLIGELAVTGEPSPSLQLALAARLRGLPDVLRDTFAAVAVVGHPLAAALLGDDAEDLAAAGLVQLGQGQLVLRHSLLTEVLHSFLTPEQRRAAHQRAAGLVTDDGERARHLAAAGDVESAYPLALKAAQQAARPGERASHLRVAADCAPVCDADPLRVEAAEALYEAGEFAAAQSVLEQTEGGTVATRATVLLLTSRVRWELGDNDGSRTANLDGLALANHANSETEVLLRVDQARHTLFLDGDYHRAIDQATDALGLARSRGVGTPRAELILGTALASAGRPGWDEHMRASLDEGRAAGDLDVEFRAANNLISAHEMDGDQNIARRVASEMSRRAHELGLIAWERQLRAMGVNLDMLAGRYDVAVEDAERLLDQPLEPRTRDLIEVARCLSLIDLGRLEDARREIQSRLVAATPDAWGRAQFEYLLAETEFWNGRLLGSVEMLDDLLAKTDGDFEIATFAHLARARACAELGRDPGQLAAPHAIRFFAALPAETAALRCLATGDHAGAADRFDEAANLWAGYHFRSSLYCQWAAGESVRRAGDHLGACQRLDAVEAAAAERRMSPILARAQRSLRQAGRRRSTPRQRTASGLTAAELDVVRLVQTGLTNAQIVTRLGRSRRTVEGQLASAAAKLGATSRGQVAALADPP